MPQLAGIPASSLIEGDWQFTLYRTTLPFTLADGFCASQGPGTRLASITSAGELGAVKQVRGPA